MLEEKELKWATTTYMRQNAEKGGGLKFEKVVHIIVYVQTPGQGEGKRVIKDQEEG